MSQEKKKLKIGIIGCGNMSKVHVRFLTKYVDKVNIAICDTDELRLSEFSSQTGITNIFSDMKDMFQQFSPDVVHIVTPPATHKNIAVVCLNHGAHVLIEKPICVNSAEAEEIAQAAQANNKLVCVDHMRSFDPLILKVKNMLARGHLGSLENISVNYSYDYLQRVRTDAAARWINNLPGGSFFDLMPHLLCLLNDLLPGLILEKSVCRKKDDVFYDLQCLFTSQTATANLHMSVNVFPLKNYIELECSNGVVKVDFRNFLVIVRKNYKLPNAIARIVGNMSVGWQYLFGSFMSIIRFVSGKLDSYAGLDKIIKLFLNAVEENGNSPVTVEEAKSLLTLTERIFEQTSQDIQKVVSEENVLEAADVLVTGGTGFIGRRLVTALLGKGLRVRILTHCRIDDELKGMFGGPVNFFKGDIYSATDVEAACQGVKTIYHLAAAMKGDWNYHLDTTITGTKNICRVAEKIGVQNLIYISTLNVYDAKNYPDNKVIDEDFVFETSPENRGSYSHAKLKAEKIVIEFSKTTSMDISIFRPGLVYGPGNSDFPGDIGKRIGSKIVLVFGMGNRKIPFVYVDNLVDALILAKDVDFREKPAIFNVIDDDYTTQQQFIKLYRELTQQKIFAIYVPYWVVFSGFWMIERLVGLILKKKISLRYKLKCIIKNPIHSTQRAQEILGWKQKVHFKEGLEQTCSIQSSKIK